MKILNIKPLGQRDDRWKNQRLGMVDGVTIGSDGCVVTSHSMLLTFHGFPILPDALDDLLTDKGLYYDEAGDGPNGDDLWVPHNISKVYTPMKYISTTYCLTTPAPISKIKEAIDRNQPPTLWVLNNGVSHNVLAVGYDGDEIIVNDPWVGDQVRCDLRWKAPSSKVILSVDYYEGPMTDSTTYVQVPAKDFEGMVFKSTQHDKTSKSWGFDDPRSTTAEQIDDKVQKSINAYKGQVSQSQAEAAQALRDLAVARQEVKNREEQVSRLKEQLTDLSKSSGEQIVALNKTIEERVKEVSALRAMLDDKQEELDAVYAQKGALQNELAGVKKELETCKSGATVPTQSLWTAILNFLKGTKVIKK